MKVLFITKSHDFMVPRGVSVLSAVAEQWGHKTFLCDMNTENPLNIISHIQPDVIGYSSTSGESKHYLKLNGIIKAKFPNLYTIMGGPHPTFYPDVIKNSTLDAICIGEGEDTLINILNGVSIGISPSRLITDLDSLPFPNYNLFYNKIPIMGKSPVKSFMVGRGCPYNCSYCFNAKWNEIYKGKGPLVRRHSVDYVIEDIRRVKAEWPLSCVKFYDDIFCYQVDDWLTEFSEKYKRYINLPFFILTRYDLLTEDMVKLLKEAGCRTISMSIEAGNPEIRDRVLNRKMTNDQILKASLLCHKYSIYTFTNAILALPHSSIKDDIGSIDLAIKAKSTWAEMSPFYPYPGTELGNKTIAEGLYKPDYAHLHTSYQNCSPLNCFNPKDKMVQNNLTTLGPVAVAFPILRNLIVNYLIYWKPNKLFILLYWAIKNYTLRRKIYVTKTTFWQSMRIYTRSLRQELFRHTEETL